MSVTKFFITCLFFVLSYSIGFGQCNQTLTINSSSAQCNGNGTSTVTINVTVLFGNGNNSATISYNIGAGEVVAVVLEDDSGDIVNQTYMFDVPTCDNFSVTLTAWTNPSGSGSSCSDPAPVTAPITLPVKFGDFYVILDKSEALIRWNTYSELNNVGFEVQRSRYNSEFKTVGEVLGAVNSSEIRKYQFEDNLEIGGLYYYRVKQNDLDGTFSFSDVRKITYSPKNELSLFPNPASNQIQFTSSKQGIYSIYNNIGQLVKTILGNEEGRTVDISELLPGAYFIISSDKTEYKKFVKN